MGEDDDKYEFHVGLYQPQTLTGINKGEFNDQSEAGPFGGVGSSVVRYSPLKRKTIGGNWYVSSRKEILSQCKKIV